MRRRRSAPKKRLLDGTVESAIRLMRSIVPDANGCQIWPAGAATNNGYGRFNARDENGKQRGILAHRASLEEHLGRKLVKGEEVMHRCDTPRCVNPEHLVVGTHRENMLDMMRKGRAGGFVVQRGTP